MISRTSYRRISKLTMSEQARQLNDASSPNYTEYQSGESRTSRTSRDSRDSWNSGASGARRTSYYKSNIRERRLRPPTMIEYAKYALKLRLLTSERDKLVPLRDKIIKIMSERYKVTSVFFIPYYRYSKKHNLVLYGLMLAYWFGDRKYRKIPLTWILRESDQKEEIEKVANILLNVSEDYLRESLLEHNIALPTVLVEYIRENSETEINQ